MNPLTNVRNLQKINDRELDLGLTGTSSSWHAEYKDSAWIFLGGLPYDLSEGDVLCVFSQYGEIVNINLVRDKDTGKFKGFGFICYEDQRSTILAVDNLNGIKILNRTIRVDHVKDYKPPKEFGDEDLITKTLRSEGCAPKAQGESSEEEDDYVLPMKDESGKKKKKKKEKKAKKEKKKRLKSELESDSDDSEAVAPVRVKEEKMDAGYDKYDISDQKQGRGRVPDTRHGERVNRESPRRYDESNGGYSRHDRQPRRGDRQDSRSPRRDDRGRSLKSSPGRDYQERNRSDTHRDRSRDQRDSYSDSKRDSYCRNDNRDRNPDGKGSYASERDSYRHSNRDRDRDRDRNRDRDRYRR